MTRLTYRPAELILTVIAIAAVAVFLARRVPPLP